MWYLKVSSSLLIAVALICMIQNAISLTLDPKTINDQWSTLESSTDQIDLKKISKICKNSMNNFNEKLENTKAIVNKRLPEPNKTTEDIVNLVSDIKTQIKNSSADLVSVRKLVQKTALRFRDTFKSLVSFTELDNESINKELENIKKTTVDSKKPLVNRVIRSFGNRYDLIKLANKVLEISSDHEKLKNNYVEKKKVAKKEFNSLWNSLSNHSKTVNDNAIKALETFFEGIKSVKSVKKKVKTLGEGALNAINVGDDINKLKNAVELAKALKLKFEDEWNLDSGELTYSEEQKKATTKTADENDNDNEQDKSIENSSTNDIEPSLPTAEQETIDNEKINIIPSTQAEIEKPSKDDRSTSNKTIFSVEDTQLPTETKNKDETKIIPPPDLEKDDHRDNNVSDNIDSSITETSFNPDNTNNETLITPTKDSVNNNKDKILNKRTSREKTPILPWQKLKELDDPQVSQQSMKCESLLNNTIPDFDNIKKSAKTQIQVTKSYNNLQKIENDIIQQFYDKMVSTNTQLSDNLVNAAEDVCANVTPINKRYETKFKNDPNIKRIKYLLGKQYDPNEYILKILDDASHKNGIGGMKKTTYYKMLAVAYNLNHEKKEMEDAALYAMNKIYEGKLAATNLKRMFNKEKASKACYIRNILLEKENDAEKKNKDENKEKVKESISDDITAEPLKPDVNLDSVDEIQPSVVNDDNGPILNNDEETKTFNETNESTALNNQGDTENDKVSDEKENIENEDEEQENRENYNDSSIPQNKDNDNDTTTDTTSGGNNTVKRSPTKKVTHHRKHRNPNDPNDVSEEYDTIEEEDETNLNESDEIKSADTPEAQTTVIGNNENDAENLEHSENNNGDANEETDEGNDSDQPKTKRRRKRIDPKDGKEISEEYDTKEEKDDNNLNDTNESTTLNNQGDTENDKVSDEKENIENEDEEQENQENYNDSSIPQNKDNDNDTTTDTTSSGNNTVKRSPTKKVTHHRKHRNPNNPNDVSEEYDTIEEEDETNLNESDEKKSADTPEAQLTLIDDNENDAENIEHSENDNGDANEETDEGNDSDQPKAKGHRKRIDPKDGKEISEEYNTKEEEDDKNLNDTNESTTINNQGDTENDKVSDEKENIENEDEEQENQENYNDSSIPQNKDNDNDTTTDTTSGGNNTVKRSPTKTVTHHRKHRNPNDPNDVSEEYDTIEEEDETNLNESDEIKSADTPEAQTTVIGNNENDAENLEHSENNNGDANEETDEGNDSDQPKAKGHRKRIDPKDGKEISEEYNTKEEEDDKNLNDTNESTTINNQGDTENDKVSDEKENIENEDEEQENQENYNDSSIPQNKDNDNDTTTDTTSGGNNTVKRSPTKTVTHHRKHRNPNDPNDVSEEYDTIEEEDETNLNESDEIKSADTPEAQTTVIGNNENDAENLEHSENNNGDANEETDEGNDSDQPKTKRRRKRIDSKDGKEISEEYDTIEEEDDNNLNELNKIKPEDIPEIESSVEEEEVKEDIPYNDKSIMNDNTNEESINDNVINKNLENITKETEELDENENLNSVEGAELNGVDNENIIQAEESMGEDSTSYETSYEEPKQRSLNNSNNNPSNNIPLQERNNIVNKHNKRNRPHRKRKDPKNGLEVSEEYDTIEEQDEEPLLGDNNTETPSETPDNTEIEESDMNAPNDADIPANKNRRRRKRKDPISGLENNNGDSPPETPDNTEIEEGSETPEFEESDMNAPNDADNQPQNNRRRRKRKDPITGLEVSEEYDSIEEQDEEPLLGDNNKETPSETPDNTEIEEDSETPEFEESDMNAPNDADIPANKNRRQRKRKVPISDLEINNGESPPETPDNTEIEEGSETPDFDEGNINAQNEVDNQPQNNRRRRKRKDPITGLEVSEEYDSIEEQDEEPLLGHNNTETPSETPDNTEVEEDSETPEFEESDMNAPNDADIPANKNRRRRTRKNPISGLENNNGDSPPETPDNTEIEEGSETPEFEESDMNAPNDADNQPQNNRRRRKRKDPITGLEVSEEYDSIEEQDEEPLLGDNNKETPSETPDNTEIEEDSETPEFEESDMNAPNDADIPANKNRRQRKRKVPISDLEINNGESPPETPDNTEIEEGSETPDFDEGNINAQNEVDNQPQNNRRRRKRKDPITGLEVSEEYDSIEEQDEEPLLGHNNTETPSETPDNTEVEEDSETPEFEESDMNAPNDADIPANKNRRRRTRKNPISGLENNNRESPAETPDNTEIEEGSETPDFNEGNINAQNEVDNQPQNNRRRRKRKDPITGLEVSEEYDSIKEQDEEPLLGHNNTETPSETHDNTEIEEDSKTPEFEESDMNAPNDADIPANKNRRRRTRKNPISGLENNNGESPAETPDNTEIEEGSETPDFDEGDINAQNEVDNQPQNNRRRRKRKDPITGLEVSEEYDSIEEQDEEPLLGHNNTETPSETPDNTEVEEDSETPEFEESDMNAPNDADIPANKNRRRRTRKNPISGLENNNRESPAETPDNTEIEEDSETPDFDEGDINAQNEVDNQPQNNRRRRKRKDPITGLEVSEEYDSIEEQDKEPLLGHNNTETPPETPDNTEVEEDSETPEFEESDMNAPNDADIPANKNRRQRKRKDPISGLENNNRESPAETPDNTEIEEGSETPDFDEGDINAQNEVDNQPQNNRRRRKRKDPITGLEVSEEYDSIEEQDKEPLLGHNNTETPPETPDNTEVEEDSETPEFEESDMNAPNDADIPANKNRRQRKRKDPISGLENNNRESPAETPDNTEIEEGSETPDFDEGDINAQNEVDNQPQNNRRRRKRKDPITGLEVSEEYDSIEEQDEEPLLGDNNKETPSETPDNTEIEEDSETPEFEESDMNAPNDADIPANKNRRRRKRKNPISDLENNNGESPAEKPDNLEIEDDSEITEFDLGDINSQNGSGNPSQKNRRHRKRKDPITGFEVSEEYDTIEEHDEEPLMGDNNRETQTDTPDNTEIDEFSETPEFDKAPYDTNEYGNVEEPSPRKFRGRRKSRQPQFVKENSNEPLSVIDNNTNNYPFDNQDNESIPYNNNDVDDEVPDTGYGETNDIENNKEEPELVEYPDNSYVPSKDYVSPNYMNENGNVAQPSPRKLRRRKNSRQPQVVNENSNEPLSVIDNNTNNYPFDNQDNESIPYNNNDVDEEVPDTGYGETNDIENNKEEPELVEYPDNSYVPSKDYVSPNYMNENGNVAQPSPRKLRRRRKSRQPQVVNENSNEPLSVIDNNTNNYPFDNQDNESIPYNNNDVDDEVPDTGYGETNDIENNKEEPELVEYPDNSYVPSKDYVSPNYMNENGNVAQPSPRKLRRRRKSRQPQVVNENSNEPLSVIDNNTNNYPFDNQDNESIPYNNNDVDDEVPDTGYGETNDIENNKEEPELVEYPDNSYVPSKDYVSPNYMNENGNVAQPSPRKLRRRKNSRQPQVVNENSNEPLSVIDNNTNNYPFDNQDNESIPYNNNDVDEEVPDTGYGETNDIENNKEEPELVEYPDNSYVPSKDYVSPNYMNENGNVAQPSPRKLRRRRKSRQPQVVNENSNEPLSVIDNNTNNYPFDNQDNESIPYNNNDVDDEVPDTGYGETNDIENNKEEPELVEYPDNSYVPSKDYVSPNYMNENGNVAQPSPRKLRRRKNSRQPQVVNENSNEPLSVIDNNTNNYPFDNQDNESIPYNNNDVDEEVPDTGYGETNDIENNKEEPELVEYPDNSYVPSKDYVSPNYMNENGNVAQPSPRKLRRRKNSRQPQVVNENSNEPLSVIDNNTNNYPFDNQDNESIPYNNNDVDEEVPDTGYGETNDIENNKEEPELVEYPDNSYVPSKDYVSPNYMNENGNVAQPSPRKLRRRRKSRQPQVVNENSNEPLSVLDNYTNNYPVYNQDVNNESVPKNESDVQDDVSIPYKTVVDSPDGIADSTSNSKKPKRKKHSGRKTIPTSVDTENSSTPNNEKSTENPEIQPKDIRRNPKKKRHIRRIRTYVVNKETNERIPINDETYSTTNGLPDALHDKLDSLEDSRFDDLDSNTDNDDYSSFLFKEYNSDQCKRNAYDRFKKVASQDAKQIAYRSVLDTSEMRSNMLATVKNAIGNVKASRTLNDVDQSLRTVSYSLKAGLKQTISDLVIKVVPLAKDFLKTTENLKELYQKGPQSTHKMLTNILENESIVPDSAKDILTLISPQFDVDELINNIFEKPCFAKSLKEKKIKAQRKLINLSKYMDTAISNIDCFVLSAMSTVGIGADTLKLLKSGRVIMSDKHPRAKILKDAVGIIKSGKNIRNNIVDFTPTLTTSDGNTESDEDDDDEDPEQVAQKNEEFLKTVPDLDDNIPVPKKFPNKRKSLGVIVVHPNKQIEYKEVNDTSQLKKFVGDQKNKYKLQSKNKHPKFLKLNSKKVIDAMVADVKKKAERNGMTKKEMIEEIIRTLNNS